MSFFRHVTNPVIAILVSAVSLGLGGGTFMIFNALTRDPTVALFNKRENPFPWLNVAQDQNIKLYAVNNKFESKEGIRTTYIGNPK
ncbi:hypothetical protein BDV3_006318 [Batrachochytrium dendrobatidis]